jgi:hypothetical protein
LHSQLFSLNVGRSFDATKDSFEELGALTKGSSAILISL